MVEDVEELGAELQVRPLGNAGRFQHAKVGVEEARSAQNAPSGISESARRVRYKPRWIEPLHQLIRQDLGRDLPIAVTEINSNPNNAVPSPGIASLWWAMAVASLCARLSRR